MAYTPVGIQLGWTWTPSEKKGTNKVEIESYNYWRKVMHDFLPITLNSLLADTIIGCDVYLLVNDNGRNKYILYCKSDAAFENEKKEMLVRKKYK